MQSGKILAQLLFKSCRVPVILFYFGAKWPNSSTILVQEFYFVLFYFTANGQTA